MSALQFDFNRNKTAVSWLGWALLILGLIAAALAVEQWQANKTRVNELNAQLVKITTPVAVQSRVKPKEMTTEEKDIAKHRQEIQFATGLPWQRMFSEIEQAMADDTALLSIRPDPSKGQLIIEGEAKDYPAILSFMEDLEHSPIFSAVHLANHEWLEDVPGKPVHFSLMMQWQVKS